MILTRPYFETLFFSGAVLFLAGCVAEEPWTRERQMQVTEMSITVSPDAAIRAAERAVREIDPRSTSFDYTSTGFRADRSFSTFMVIAAMQGTYTYDVSVRPGNGGSVVTTKIYQDSTAITAAGTTPTGASMWQTVDAYQLLQDRIRYHAGLTSDWVTCKEARAKYNTNGAIEPICLGATVTDPSG